MKRIICWLFGHEPKLTFIKKGDRIVVDKGIFGRENGKFVNVKGAGVFGVWGEYIGEDGKKHIYDQDVHRIKKENQEADTCKRCGKSIYFIGKEWF